MRAILGLSTSSRPSRPIDFKRKRAGSDLPSNEDSEEYSSPPDSLSASFSSPPFPSGSSLVDESESEDGGDPTGNLPEEVGALEENEEVSRESSNQPESKKPRQNPPDMEVDVDLGTYRQQLEEWRVQCEEHYRASHQQVAEQLEELPRAKAEVQTLQERVADLESLLSKEQARRTAAENQSLSWQEDLLAAWEENEKLQAQLQTHKNQKSVSGLTQGAFWQFAIEGRWEAFSPEANEMMNRAYLQYLQEPSSRYVTITSGGVPRQIDFFLLEQKHLQTQRVRRIRFEAGVPGEWVTAPPALLSQGSCPGSFYREVTDGGICAAIQDILRNTGHPWDPTSACSCMSRAEIKSVHRIENFHLWHRYKAKLATMRQDHARFGISVGSAELDLDGKHETMTESQIFFDCDEPLAPDVDEKILLHGTSSGNADAIVSQGFDHRTCQHGFYGSGVYFAGAACKSHQYTCEHKRCCPCTHERTLIIARVALGDSYTATETRKGERRPPLRGDGSGPYDSIVAKPGPIRGHHNLNQMHQEFVIFHNEQAYPSYVVQYTT